MIVWKKENKTVWAQRNNSAKVGIDETYIPMLCGCRMTMRAHAAQQGKKQHFFINLV